MLTPLISDVSMDLYRVPFRSIKDEHTVFVSDMKMRYFTTGELPDEIKIKLAMILAYDDKSYVKTSVLSKMEDDLYLYLCPYPKEFKDVGWRYNEIYFCLVLSRLLLNSLEGETLNGNP